MSATDAGSDMSTADRVIRALAGASEPITMSEIHDRMPAEAAYTGEVTRAVWDLHKSGRVLRIALGRNRYGYRLNPSSTAVIAVAATQLRRARRADRSPAPAPMIGPLTDCVERLMREADRYWAVSEIVQSLSPSLSPQHARQALFWLIRSGIVSRKQFARECRYRFKPPVACGEVLP